MISNGEDIEYQTQGQTLKSKTQVKIKETHQEVFYSFLIFNSTYSHLIASHLVSLNSLILSLFHCVSIFGIRDW